MNILSIDSKLEIIENFEKVFLRMDFKDASYSAYFQNKKESDGLKSQSKSDFQNFRTFMRILLT